MPITLNEILKNQKDLSAIIKNIAIKIEEIEKEEIKKPSWKINLDQQCPFRNAQEEQEKMTKINYELNMQLILNNWRDINDKNYDENQYLQYGIVFDRKTKKVKIARSYVAIPNVVFFSSRKIAEKAYDEHKDIIDNYYAKNYIS